MTRVAIALSKAFIALLIVAGLFAQTVLLPMYATEVAESAPELAFLRWPVLVLAILVIACGQVVLGCVWRLLSLVRADVIFSSRAFIFVDVMIGSLVAAAALILAILFTLELAADAGEPPLFMAALGVALACISLALVVLVMRGLLVKASEQQSYLSEVV